jgi:Primase C terminal 2 (PriCT-2)/Bifunctional DNA primase/polymerase, N-terminal
MSALMIPAGLAGAQLIPVAPGEKGPKFKNWPECRLSLEEARGHISRSGNLAVRWGRSSGDLVDADLDAAEAVKLAPTYLPGTSAIFGRRSKQHSHWIYRAPGAIYAAFADPLDGTMLCELRADGRDGGAHVTVIPPSIADGERREWDRGEIEPAEVDAAVLTRRVAWLAIGCLTMRHISEHAACRPNHDLPDLLWEVDRALGRRAYHWINRLAPDEQPPDLKPRRQYTAVELRLEEIVAAIPNDCTWDEWNRIGLAIFAASDGSELGFVCFDDFSARSPKYNPQAVLERWRNYRRSPPSRISLGTLVRLAQQAGWHPSVA